MICGIQTATIISLEEQFRGWAAQIHRLHADPQAQIPAFPIAAPLAVLRRMDRFALGGAIG